MQCFPLMLPTSGITVSCSKPTHRSKSPKLSTFPENIPCWIFPHVSNTKWKFDSCLNISKLTGNCPYFPRPTHDDRSMLYGNAEIDFYTFRLRPQKFHRPGKTQHKWAARKNRLSTFSIDNSNETKWTILHNEIVPLIVRFDLLTS